jgi:site-specific DNA-cytosine methylase
MPRLLELFSGTGSVGRAFIEKGWEVVSVDLDPKANSTITANILTWDYKIEEPGYFDSIWASPVCTHYSIARTTAKTPRDLEGSDRLVQRVLDIIGYHKPQGGFLLKIHRLVC